MSLLWIHAVVGLALGLATARACTSDLDCSLNGVCGSDAACECTRPWGGPRCGVLQYAVTPRGAHSLFDQNKSYNTWNGPIAGPVEPPAGGVAGNGGLLFHIFVPLYANVSGIPSLFRTLYVMHGTAEAIEGPYSWSTEAHLTGGINPAFLTFPNATTGKPVYTLWDGSIRAALSPAMHNFTRLPGRGDCGSNRAPTYANGTFYCTSQHTTELFSAQRLGDPWAKVADINLTLANGTSVSYASQFPAVEDPFLWVDRRGNFHIINHRYVNSQTTNCYSSTVSAHVFSPDGRSWHALDPPVEPYGHTVHYDDGSTFTFVTLERPNAHFNADGVMTHINFAADLTTGDAGCNSGTARANRPRSCAECKFYRHCGTTLVALAVD